MTSASGETAAAPLGDPSRRDLSHIPGEEGWPVLGITLSLLADPKGEVERLARTYGPVYRSHALGARSITLLGPDANEFVLFDRSQLFSSTEGWNPLLRRLFPRGLMLLDFDEHRLHRKALSVAFKADPLRAYLKGLNAGIARGVSTWPSDGAEMRFYPAIKQLTLELAATSFFGRDLGPEGDALKHAFVAMVAAAVAVVRAPVPGTKMARGVRGRAYVVDTLKREIGARRSGDGEDLFTHLCRARLDDGRLLSEDEIADHMSFLMMAAHDTLTSSITSFVWHLAAHPNWQTALREEIAALAIPRGEPLPYEALDRMPLADMAFREALRLIPPVPAIPRRVVRDANFRGFALPAGTRVTINPLFTHRMPEVWANPDAFDPLRFTEENTRFRHKYAYIPYGGGSHMCLGLHFATMQAKAFAFHFLGSRVVEIERGYVPPWRFWPIPQPGDGLRVRLRRA